MACWYPSDTAEAWFPQLRINRLKAEAQEAVVEQTATLATDQNESKPKRRRKTAAVADAVEI